MVHKAGPTSGLPPATGPVADNIDQQIKLTLESGAFPIPSKDAAGSHPDSAGTGSKWFVKGGSFAFRIAPDFALSSTPGNLARIAKEGGYNEIPLGPNDAPEPLKSTPMHLDDKSPEITSILMVTITKLEDDPTKNSLVSAFKPAYIIKSVPAALWREYSTDRDPMLPGHGKELLNPSASTMKQIMGLSISAPDPVLAISNIPPFNATDAMKQEVLNGDKSWFIPLPGAKQIQELLPAPVITPEMDTPEVLLPLWEGVKTAWQDSAAGGLELTTGMAALCATTLGWDVPLSGQNAPIGKSGDAGTVGGNAKAPGGDAKAPVVNAKAAVADTQAPVNDVAPKSLITRLPVSAWKLSTQLPHRLVIGTGGGTAVQDVMDGFENYYLALPRIGLV